MLSIIKKAHKKVPPNLKMLYMPFVNKVSGQIRDYTQKIENYVHPSVSIFEGLEKNSKSPLTFAYVGSDVYPERESYWSQICLTEVFQKHDLGRHFIWNIFSFLKNSSHKCDFLLIEDYCLNLHFYYKISGFNIPHWVSMELDISAPIEKLLGSQRREIERKIRKNKLSHIITKDKKSFDDFYFNMFAPYAQLRHGSTVTLFSYKSLWKMFSRGILILIKKEDQVVAGGLLEFTGSKVCCRCLGIRDGKMEYVHDGVLGAIYYFQTIEMKKQNYIKLFIGGTRPFLNDSVTKHKISLDAYFIKDKKRPSLWLGLFKNSEGLKHFLGNNPFIFTDEKKDLYGAFWGELKDEKILEKYKDIVNSSCRELKNTFFFTFDESNNDQNKKFFKRHSFEFK